MPYRTDSNGFFFHSRYVQSCVLKRTPIDVLSSKHCVYFVFDYVHKILFYKDAAADGDRGGVPPP